MHRFRRLAAAAAVSAALGLLAACAQLDEGAPEGGIQLAAMRPPATPRLPLSSLQDDRFVTADGTELPLRHWLPAGQPRAVIVALHGFNDYSNAFTAPAEQLVGQGIAVFAYDQRCFGQAPQRGHWAGQETLTEDAILAATLLRRRYPEIPVYLLGESMGGAIAVLATTRRAPAPVDGIILSAPAVWGRSTMNIFERAGLWIAGLLPPMHVSGRNVPFKVHPSDNIAVLRALSADPLVIKETRTDSLAGLVDLMSAALVAAPRLDVPALILYGAHDDLIPQGALTRFVEQLPAAARTRQRIAYYPDGYHLLLRDLHADAVLHDITAWIADPQRNLPSGADHNAAAPFLQAGQKVATA
ncbi:MAG: alpha/beta hydrolase, partial [Rhodospirillales bacterium]|nr:alpha/beta hydrolase [Rhodospirillales bacterium]